MSRSAEPSLLQDEVQAFNATDLMVAVSCHFTLQVRLSFLCHFAADTGGLPLLMAKFPRQGTLRSTHKSCTYGHVS